MQRPCTFPERMTPQRAWQLERLRAGYCQECGAEPRELREFTNGPARRLTLGAACRQRQNAARRERAAREKSSR